MMSSLLPMRYEVVTTEGKAVRIWTRRKYPLFVAWVAGKKLERGDVVASVRRVWPFAE